MFHFWGQRFSFPQPPRASLVLETRDDDDDGVWAEDDLVGGVGKV